MKTCSTKRHPGARAPWLSIVGKLFLMFVPCLIIAGIVTGLGIHLSDSWQEGALRGATASQEEREDVLFGEQAMTDLTRASEAINSANTSASVLKDGMSKLTTGAEQLKNGTTQTRQGGQQLSGGLDQVADGTRRLGQGAKQVAGGVDQAVDGVLALRRYQLAAAAAVDAAIPTLVGNDPDTVRTREALKNLSRVLKDKKASDEAAAQLKALRNGANEISRQLNPGGPYYEGVMAAQNGSHQLSSGLVQLDSGTAELIQGVSKLNGIAKTNAKNTSVAYKALLTLQKRSSDRQAAAQAEAQLEAQNENSKPTLPLTQAYLVSALLALAAAAAWWSRLRLTTMDMIGVWFLMTLVASTACLTTMQGLNPVTGAFMVSTIGVGAAALLTAAGAIVLLLGRKWGLLVNLLLAYVQASVSGFVWLEEWPSRMSRFFDSLMPVSYITSALAAIGNGGDATMAWLSSAALLVLATISIFVALTVVRQNPRAGVPARISVDPHALSDEIVVLPAASSASVDGPAADGSGRDDDDSVGRGITDYPTQTIDLSSFADELRAELPPEDE